MYLNFYGLNKEPFGTTPDPAFLFLSPSHKEALAGVIYGIKKRKGFVVITGEVGMGKTTILRSYLKQAAKENLKTVYLFNTNVTFPALLNTICQELSLPVITHDPGETLRLLHQFLIQEYRRGGNVVLIIDEAQNMPMETLENIRMLSNLETASDKLIQIIFSGQPEFDQLLNCYELRQLQQRIAVKVKIAPLSKKESAAYVKYRLKKAGKQNEPIFTSSALKCIIRHAHGIPRVLNILCDNALITAYGYKKKPVKRFIVKEIIRDLTSKAEPIRRGRWISFAGLLIICGVFGVVFSLSLPQLNFTRKEGPDNLNAQPIAQKIVFSKRVSEDLLPSYKENVATVQVCEESDMPATLVENINDEYNQGVVGLVKRHNSGFVNIRGIVVRDKISIPLDSIIEKRKRNPVVRKHNPVANYHAETL